MPYNTKRNMISFGGEPNSDRTGGDSPSYFVSRRVMIDVTILKNTLKSKGMRIFFYY